MNSGEVGAITDLKIGCCGFPLPKPAYSQEFSVVEVQQTFYEPPRTSTLENWRSQVPPGFEFTLKAWQLITHDCTSPTYRRLRTKLSAAERAECGSFRDTEMVHRAWNTSLACAKALGAKLILLQCPASFTPTAENLEQLRTFTGKINRGNLTLLWEPRGNWPLDMIRSLCDELNLVHAVDPFLSTTVSKELVYYRLHGAKDYKHVFTPAEFEFLRSVLPAGGPSYVMFNNIAMLADAKRFRDCMPLSLTMPGQIDLEFSNI